MALWSIALGRCKLAYFFWSNEKPQGRGALAASRWRRMLELFISMSQLLNNNFTFVCFVNLLIKLELDQFITATLEAIEGETSHKYF